VPLTVPINHYLGVRNQQNSTKVLFHYPMLTHTMAKACFEHSDFLKVNVQSTARTESTTRAASREKAAQHQCIPNGRPAQTTRNPTTSFLTATTLIYAIGAGITAAAGTRLALQWILVKGFKLYSFQLQDSKSPVLLFLVTTSLCQDWVICAPAAFLGCGSRLSGSLSGIEP
jgi:hypothetical protein